MLERGSVVISLSGRDKGRKMVVVEIIDEDYVLVADGDLRKIEKPKRKKRKHIKKMNHDQVEIISNSQLATVLGGGVIG
ncbi:MAG: hypothetical protein Q4A41_02830 [Bacillota bacterium]|nr:hypothetical protein [Bacillota bacterium]